jgi:prepilin-type N-terminal cleavage/methylation domain-containing protein
LIPVTREFKGTFVNRKGITLLEVLMAIFIMGIGMVSVFAIFPVAALMMGQAIEKYQVNEVVNNTQSNFDTDALEFVKNQPTWIYSQLDTVNPLINSNCIPVTQNFLKVQTTSSAPLYLFLDQAAGPTRSSLGGVTVAYINGGVSPALPAQINERYFTSNFDIELDESGRAVFPVASAGKYSVSFLLEKKPPLDNPLPSRRYMLVYKGRSQTFAPFPWEAIITNVASAPNLINPTPGALDYKKQGWIMTFNSVTGNRSFHQIIAVNPNGAGIELEVKPKLGTDADNVYLLSDVVRVIDMGAG